MSRNERKRQNPEHHRKCFRKKFRKRQVANISVATDYGYTTKDGNSVIETTWHYVTAWEVKDIQNLDQLKKGSFIHVLGRLRNRKYTAADGTERIAYDIMANKVQMIERPSARV